MRSRAWVSASLVALGLALPPLEGQETKPPVLKPFALDDDGKPIPRAEPVTPAATPRPAAPKPAPAPPPPAGVVAPPKPMTVPDSAEPGTIRVTPSGTPRSAEQLQIDLANGYYAKKMFDLAAPDIQKVILAILRATVRILRR